MQSGMMARDEELLVIKRVIKNDIIIWMFYISCFDSRFFYLKSGSFYEVFYKTFINITCIEMRI